MVIDDIAAVDNNEASKGVCNSLCVEFLSFKRLLLTLEFVENCGNVVDVDTDVIVVVLDVLVGDIFSVLILSNVEKSKSIFLWIVVAFDSVVKMRG